MCDKIAALSQPGDGSTFPRADELIGKPFPWVSTKVKWPRSLQEERGGGERKSGMEMTDDRARRREEGGGRRGAL